MNKPGELRPGAPRPDALDPDAPDALGPDAPGPDAIPPQRFISPALPPIYARGGLSAELYDSMYPGAPGEEDTQFLLEQATITGGPILELACGTGRVLWPLAEAGFEITGLDLNRPMLAQAEGKAAARPADVRARARFLQSGMQEFDLKTTFGLVFSTFRSFQALLTVEEQRSCLRSVHRHLRPGGRLVLDLFDPQLDRLLPRDP